MPYICQLNRGKLPRVISTSALAVIIILSASPVTAAGEVPVLPSTDSTNPPAREINLRGLGYRPALEYHYAGGGIPRDLSVLNDDDKKRLTFINEKTLVVYLSHFQPQAQKDASLEPRSMEAFFIDTSSGGLMSRKTWPTIKRRWMNERWDTQARIIAVREGFLVQAVHSLTLYSADQKEKGVVPLEDGPSWSAVVAPLGRTIHLQRIDRGSARGEWLDSETLKKIQGQDEVPGITSASDRAVVTKLARCVQMQAVAESARNLCCSDSCRIGLPEFLSDAEVLSVYRDGFTVLSVNGEELWSQEAADRKSGLIESYKRSLGGNRFAISVRGDRHTVFDQVKVPNGRLAIFVYDRATRKQVFQFDLGSIAGRVDFALSPGGTVLAVLLGDVVRLYNLPS
jgi:hypothetical protein